MKQLTLFDLQTVQSPSFPAPLYDPSWNEIVLEQDTLSTVPEQKTPGYEPHTDVPEHIKPVLEHRQLEFLQWVEQYRPSTRKGHLYYRYCWKQVRKIHHMHISGGNTRSPITQERKQMVESAITVGLSPNQISALIKSWKFI